MINMTQTPATILQSETYKTRRGETCRLDLVELAAKDRSGCQWEIRSLSPDGTIFSGASSCRTLAAAEKKFRSALHQAKTSRW